MGKSRIVGASLPIALFAALASLAGCPNPDDATPDNTPPAGVPDLLQPMQGTNTGADRRPLFRWCAVAEAETYELQVDDNADFTSVEYNWVDLEGTSYRPISDLAVSASAPVGTRYYWRMRALDAAGNVGSWTGSTPLRYVNVGRFNNDFNGDGYADTMVGASGYNSNQGRAYLYHGGPAIDTVADVTFTGEATNNSFGSSVASAGDVNGDGFADAIVGAFYFNSQRGRVYLYYGGSTMDTIADLTLTGEATGNCFGRCVASAGDVNGDGYADVIVGAELYNSAQGRAYLYLGGPGLDTTAELTITGEATGTYIYFGYSVAPAGDVNGDGYTDAMVGAYGYNSERGRTYLYFGGPAIDATADITLNGDAAGDRFGRCVAPAGDVNGDGYSDALVGANAYNSNQGRAYLFYGGSAMDTTADLTLTGEATGNYFGRAVAPAGDVNGDGYADIVAGAMMYNSNQGRAYLYYGGPGIDTTADCTFTGEATGNYFGCSTATAGDVNGDGYADIVAGAYGYSSSQGRAYLFYGGAAMDIIADLTPNGEATNDFFGIGVASAGM